MSRNSKNSKSNNSKGSKNSSNKSIESNQASLINGLLNIDKRRIPKDEGMEKKLYQFIIDN